jgi:hypothetical protein
MKGIPRPISIREISDLKLKRCFRKHCQLFASHMEEPSTNKSRNLEDFLVTQEFKDAFGEILGFPPKRDIDFFIDPMPETNPISKTHYRMSTLELK